MAVTAHRPPAQAAQPRRPGWLRRRNLTRIELGCVAAWHLGVATIIAVVPKDRIITPSTRAIFGGFHWPIWVVLFVLVAALAASAVWRPSETRLWFTWAGVFPIGMGWIWGFIQGLPYGGNPLFPFAWTAVLVWWLFTAIRSLTRTGDRWSG